MAKAAKETTFMVSVEGTGYFYTNRRNKKKNRGEKKMSLSKYDPVARKHVKFNEKKLSALKKKYVASGSTSESDNASEVSAA